MSFECYIKQPMKMVDLNLNIVNFKNPHSIDELDRSIKHFLNRKSSNVPFK